MNNGGGRRFGLGIIDFSDEPGIHRDLYVYREVSAADYERYRAAASALVRTRRANLLDFVEDTLAQAEVNVEQLRDVVMKPGPASHSSMCSSSPSHPTLA